MKICILGNSHAASLKQGWDGISADWGHIALDFFASRSRLLGALAVEENFLVPASAAVARQIKVTSGGRERVALDEYDVFLTYGLDLAVPRLAENLSSAVKLQTCRDVLAASLNLQLCRLIRSASRRPVYVGHTPQLAAGAADRGAAGFLPYRTVHGLLASEIAPEDFSLVAQPESTLVDDWFTRPRFSFGSTRLDVGDRLSNRRHGSGDVTHMNGEFGRIWLLGFFAVLEAAACAGTRGVTAPARHPSSRSAASSDG